MVISACDLLVCGGRLSFWRQLQGAGRKAAARQLLPSTRRHAGPSRVPCGRFGAESGKWQRQTGMSWQSIAGSGIGTVGRVQRRARVVQGNGRDRQAEFVVLIRRDGDDLNSDSWALSRLRGCVAGGPAGARLAGDNNRADHSRERGCAAAPPRTRPLRPPLSPTHQRVHVA